MNKIMNKILLINKMKFVLFLLFLVIIIALTHNKQVKKQTEQVKDPIINEQNPGKGFSDYYSPQQCSPKNNCFARMYVR